MHVDLNNSFSWKNHFIVVFNCARAKSKAHIFCVRHWRWSFYHEKLLHSWHEVSYTMNRIYEIWNDYYIALFLGQFRWEMLLLLLMALSIIMDMPFDAQWHRWAWTCTKIKQWILHYKIYITTKGMHTWMHI